MNSYERVMAALELKEPDRVPILEWAISPHVIKAICPQANDQTDFEEIMDLDAVCTAAQFHKVSAGSEGTYTDEWGVIFRSGPEITDHPLKGPIRTKDDLRKYIPPDPNAPYRLGRLPELVARFKKKKAIVFRHRAAFMWSVFLHGFDDLLADFLADPEFAHELLDKVLETNIQVARNAVRAGADVVLVADDYAGNDAPFFSPAVFKEFVLPRLQRMVDAIHQEGGKVVKHTDGNLWPILDMIVNTGIDGLNPMEPVAGMDIGEVKQRHGKRVCLIGNIDCARLLCESSEEEVEAAVKECIHRASPGGGHIISSSNSIHSSVKPQNYAAMIAATKKYGKYPMRGKES